MDTGVDSTSVRDDQRWWQSDQEGLSEETAGEDGGQVAGPVYGGSVCQDTFQGIAAAFGDVLWGILGGHSVAGGGLSTGSGRTGQWGAHASIIRQYMYRGNRRHSHYFPHSHQMQWHNHLGRSTHPSY
eukprot:scaffold51318_cov38-Attheya_sp.AAC.1